jgi:probable HAF family extracellular repeat protein
MLHNKVLTSLIGSVLFLGTAMAQNQPVFSSVDYPGAVLTNAQGINPGGDVVGYYKDALGNQHGFLLSEGNFTSIDYPGVISTDVRGISPGGDIVGSYTVAPGGPANTHGYLLSLGTFTELQYPGHPGMFAQRIAPNGDVYGCYHDTDTAGSMHGMTLMRTARSFMPMGFDAAPASMRNGATPDGSTIVGLYTDLTTGLTHGYLVQDGNFQRFDVPGSNLTQAWDINPKEAVVGLFRDTTGKVHGFLLSKGTFTTIDYPSAIATRAFGINPGGDVVGAYVDSSGNTHGFLRKVTD